ncbi:hypothetical protein GDO78_016195 [Eleutherodactylus coqui]|uniref:Uncharacterized protein n=1 Tax=Eleutherodactylus coqui TaxID=57060 RepID=A0A8J6EL77_ELECQ|nr:hypothetical protein GDO78_016195 [Eleutherodactylus coqui]
MAIILHNMNLSTTTYQTLCKFISLYTIRLYALNKNQISPNSSCVEDSIPSGAAVYTSDSRSPGQVTIRHLPSG